MIKQANEVDLTSIIEKETMPIDEFLKLPPVPHQRFTEGRANTAKVKKMLSILRPEHLEVAIVELTEDCEYHGEIYQKGWRGIANGNTRRLYWEQGLSNVIPTKVFATIYKQPNMNEVKDCYNTFDSLDATEQKKEKVYGFLNRIYQYNASSPKIKNGNFLSALNLACHYFDSEVYNSSNAKVEALPAQIGLYINEIKAFDSLCQNAKSWDQTLMCAAFMSLKKYGLTNKRLLECLDAIDRRAMNTMQKDRDGATHINLEWQTNEKFPQKVTSWEKAGGMKEQVSFALYWIEKYMEGQKLSQPGFNWKETGKSYFDVFKKMNPNLSSNVIELEVKKAS